MTTVRELLSMAIVRAIGAFAVLPPRIDPVPAEQLLAVRGVNSVTILGRSECEVTPPPPNCLLTAGRVETR